MTLQSMNIYTEELTLSDEAKNKCQKIESVIRKVCEQPDLNLRLVQTGEAVEGLLWGHLGQSPIGAYNRGASVLGVLESLHKKVKKDCLKILKSQIRASKHHSTSSHGFRPMERAG